VKRSIDLGLFVNHPWFLVYGKNFCCGLSAGMANKRVYTVYLAWLQFENYFMWPNNFSDSFVFCSRMFCFILQTSECFHWVSLTYNHSVVATVCWNAVISVKNISSCGPQRSTVIVSFLWSTVRCLLRTDHNKKVKPPVSHAPIWKETVFRKINFILAYAETINKRLSKWVI